MLQHHELSNAASLSGHGTSAHETGAPSSLNTNALRFYTPQGSRHRRPSDTAELRDALSGELLRLRPDIRRIRLRDTGTLFLITLYLPASSPSTCRPASAYAARPTTCVTCAPWPSRHWPDTGIAAHRISCHLPRSGKMVAGRRTPLRKHFIYQTNLNYYDYEYNN